MEYAVDIIFFFFFKFHVQFIAWIYVPVTFVYEVIPNVGRLYVSFLRFI